MIKNNLWISRMLTASETVDSHTLSMETQLPPVQSQSVQPSCLIHYPADILNPSQKAAQSASSSRSHSPISSLPGSAAAGHPG